MATELKPSSLDFGVVIAFVAPGFIVLRGVSYHVATIAGWVNMAADKEQGVGVFLFVLLASLSAGLVVSGLRDLVVDAPFRWAFWGKQLVAPLELDWSKVTAENLAILIVVRDNHYRYYQFYSNTAVALVLWFLLHGLSPHPGLPRSMYAFLTVAVILLLWAAKRALSRYVEGVGQLLKSE